MQLTYQASELFLEISGNWVKAPGTARECFIKGRMLSAARQRMIQKMPQAPEG